MILRSILLEASKSKHGSYANQ